MFFLQRFAILWLIVVWSHSNESVRLTVENIGEFGASNRLENRNLHEIEPQALELITDRVLYLANNELEYLPENLFHFNRQFQKLFFRQNLISDIHPLAFENLVNLTDLSLEHNLLRELDDTIFATNTKLEKLLLAENKIMTISPLAFKNLINLVNLDLSQNRLKRFDISQLYSSRNMRSLWLAYNQLLTIEYKSLATLFPQLSTLSLSGNYFNCTLSNAIIRFAQRQGIRLKRDNVKSSYFVTCLEDNEYEDMARTRYTTSQIDEILSRLNAQEKMIQEQNQLYRQMQSQCSHLLRKPDSTSAHPVDGNKNDNKLNVLL